jgi:V8-like Glu-specific endopeptidase
LAESDEKALCGADDSEWAQCLQSSEPTVYDKSRAVARLMIGGTSACTGWLVGSEGHLMTNEHCISTASAAANTDYEFMAEGSCSTECKSWGGCPGTVVASSGTLIQVDATLDYSLILLPNNPSTTYGYLQMRNAGAALGERIYIPQHAQAWGKRIAIKAGNNDAVVTSVTETPCSGGSGKDVGYMADTQGGSSGSPVLGYADHAVVALHHSANCPNRGVPIESVLEDLNAGGNLPADATTEAPPPPPVCFPAGTACVDNADCCSNSCKGRSGAKTCK